MQTEEIKSLIEAQLPGSIVKVAGEGCNARVLVVSAAFAGQSKLAQQRMVYKCLGDKIASGEIHALSIKSFTPEQWEQVADKDSQI